MIGVFCKDHEKEIAQEFFELFKTPWEFYAKDRSYDVVLSTRKETPAINGKILVVYGSEENPLDSIEGISAGSRYRNVVVDYNGTELPIYGNILTLEGGGRPPLRIRGTSGIVGLETNRVQGKLLRIGFDLFQEVAFLLSVGQPIENAHVPTLEVHISMLRDWILDAGIPVVEIPPVPMGYDCIACLTHDVDFVRIRDHKLDHTMWGFVYRAAFGSLLDVWRRKIPWTRFLQNWKAVLSLPGVYLGLCKDFWFQDFDRFLQIEKELKSTFFFIPFKNRPGDRVSGQHSERRATQYDITDVQELAKNLVRQGFEIGVHGIDAWHNSERGRQELNRISEVTGKLAVGIRVHWLCFDEDSLQTLDEAGFLYDSTLGYNETIGYRGGTSQVFRPLGVRNLLELPLHIQDGALFYRGRLSLTDSQAWNLCQALLNNASKYGGVLTILWHTRSLAPERLWGDFYLRLLKDLESRRAWFRTAEQIVEWFRGRRALSFCDVSFDENKLHLSLKYEGKENASNLMLRVHLPGVGSATSSQSARSHIDIPWTGEKEVAVTFDNFTKSFTREVHNC